MHPTEFQELFDLIDQFNDRSNVKIKFYSGSLLSKERFNLNLADYSLKTWHDLNGRSANRWIWLDSGHIGDVRDTQKYIDELSVERPDVICFSLYVWSISVYDKLARRIKELWPSTVIVVGGPSVYAHKDDKFWNDHPWVDVAVYGDGERAFSMLLDTMIDWQSINEVPHNICFRSRSKSVSNVIPFQRLKDKNFQFVSHVKHNEDIIRRRIQEYKSAFPDAEISINWEFTRGCPYACSFCDWSSGLHHKVTRKLYDYKQDLDFFASCGVTVRWVDANVGIYKEDAEVIHHAWLLEDQYPDFQFTFINMTKLNKAWVYDMIDQYETRKPNKISHMVSLQDINSVVLNNIDRPEIPWDDHKELIKKLIHKHPKVKLRAEIMVGLPGQDLSSFGRTLTELSDSGIQSIMVHLWTLLPNSPAYDQDYRQKFGIQTVEAHFIENFNKNLFRDRDHLAQNIDEADQYSGEMIISTYTADLADIMGMFAMAVFYRDMLAGNFKYFKNQIKKTLVNKTLWREIGSDISSILLKDINERGKIYLAIQTSNGVKTVEDYLSSKETHFKIIKATAQN